MNYHLKMFSNSILVRQFSLNVNKNQKKNHYDCLGVTPKATQRDIKNAYYKLSKQYHPDTNSGNVSAAEKFRDIAEAYEILGNLKARKRYDRGILIRKEWRDACTSDEPVSEKYKHAQFYHHRNKPTKSTSSDELRNFDMDEWTRSHYSQTFTAANFKKEKGRAYMEDKIQTKKENENIIKLLGVLMIIMAFGFMYGTDASKKYDQVSLDRPFSKENTD